MGKKRILFVFPDLCIGGATSAFIALLKKMQFDNHEVDVLFLNNGEFRLSQLPEQIRILPDAAKADLLSPTVRMKKIANFLLTGKAFTALRQSRKNRNVPFEKAFQMATNQMLARIHSEICDPLEEEYDLAVAYLELWPTAYVAQKVKAKKKLAWVHVDYSKIGMNPGIDADLYAEMDQIVGVSEACAKQLCINFPQYESKITWVENYVDAEMVHQRAKLPITLEEEFQSYGGFRIVTVARLTSYIKGLDRIVNISKSLKAEGFDFRWYLIGDGEDEQLLKNSIEKNSLSDTLFLLGGKDNPYPYMEQADLFVLASRNEGKPITVSEAQILHTPVLVTRYPSAQKQMEGGNGIIVENNEDALLDGLRDILGGSTQLHPTRYLESDQTEQLSKMGIL